MQSQNTKTATKKPRSRVPVITQERYRDCFPVEFVICLDCDQRQELSLEYPRHCLKCDSDNVVNHVLYRNLESIKRIDSLTLQEWCKVLPSLISIQKAKGNKNLTWFLERKLLTLQQL